MNRSKISKAEWTGNHGLYHHFFFMGESRMIQRAPVEILPRWHCGDDDDDEEGQGMKMTMAAGRLLF